MPLRNQCIIHVPNVESAKCIQTKSKTVRTDDPVSSKGKLFKIKSAASREFDAYESYYDINDVQDYSTRKEKYIVEDYLFKNKLKCQPITKSRYKLSKCSTKPLQCYASHCYPNEREETKAAGPIKHMDIEIDDKNLKESFLEPNADIDPKEVRMDWENYHRLSVIHRFMEDLESNYPSLCTTGIIGKSLEGRDLKILKISNSDSNNDCVWIDAGIHAREWIAPAVNTYVADHIAKNFDNLPKSVRSKDWYFLPVLNPDGYEYSHTTKRMWRKNKAYVKNQLYGVDLNRNFSFAWGGQGSSDEPRHAFYRGPKPFSEPESSAMRDIFLHSGIKFKVYLTLHSFGQVIIMPFAYREELAHDYIRLLEGATVMSKAIYDTNGNTYKVGISKDVMYHASGTSNDWSHGAVGIPYCYLIELRSRKHKFKLPKEEIAETGKEILNSVIALMEFIDNYKAPNIERTLSTPKPEDSSEIINPNIIEFKEEIPCESQNNNTDSKFKTIDIDLTSKTDFRSMSDNDIDEEANQMQLPVAQFVEDLEQIDTISKRNCGVRKDKTSMKNRLISFIKKINKTKENIQKSYNESDYNMPTGDNRLKKNLISYSNNQSLTKAINIWKEESSTMDIMVEGPRIAQIGGMLNERAIPFSVAVPNVEDLCKKELEIEMDWNNYHRLDTIYGFMDNLAAQYPHLCHVSVIGRTAEGRDLKLLKISNGKKGNEGVWIDGAIHAREWISPAVVTYIADQIVRNFQTHPNCITNKDWFIVPVLNPDGYEYTHTHDRMWRKNRALYGECIGVDLNRNWSHGWGEKGEEGSSEDPGNIFFRGPKPFSEVETAAVKNTILESTTVFKVFLSLHSYGEAIIFPWGCTSDPCPDYIVLLEGGTAIAKAIHQTSGHTYKVGSTKDLMYYACGTSTDWSYAVAKIPFSYMIELRAKQHRFLLPKEEIDSTAKEIYTGVIQLLEFVDDKK